MRLQIDECLNIQCQCVVSIPWLELSGTMLLELMMTSDLLRSIYDQEQQLCQQAKLVASDGGCGDVFGYSLSLSGYYTLIGAEWDDSPNANQESAYIYLWQELHVL